MNVAAALKRQVLEQLVADVIGATFALSGHALPQGAGGALDAVTLGWPTARVQLLGSHTVQIWVAIRPDLGRHIVVSAVGCAPEEVSLDMIQDVAAELANMLAGQVKSTLGEVCEMGLPEKTLPYNGPVSAAAHFAALTPTVEDLYLAVL